MIPRERWHWCGYGGHFIAADRCRLRMHTRVGAYRISTVGHYVVRGRIENVGAGRTFETMVFALRMDGSPEAEPMNWSEAVEMRPYNDSRAAEAGHIALCEKYAAIQEDDGEVWDAAALERYALADPSPRNHGTLWDRHEARTAE